MISGIGGRISVVIPVYNGARYLAAAVDSVLGQTRAPDEVIVVDDGSTDATPAVIASYGLHLVALRQANRGGGAATNAGIAAATGDLLAFLDADDVWLPDKLALQLAVLAGADAPDMAFGHVVQFVSPDMRPEHAERLWCPAEPQRGVHRSTLLIRRAAFDRVGRFDESLHAVDFIDWYPRAIEAGLRAAVVPQVVVRRRLHDANNGVRLRTEQRATNVDVIKRMLDRRRTNGPGGPVIDAILRPDHALLLRAALLEGDAARDAYAQWRKAVDFDAIDGNGVRLVPLLYRNLRALGCGDAIMSRMKGIWRRTWVENHIRIDACRPAVATLAEAGIPTIMLKGAAMLARWVDDVGVRPMADFDLLVPRAQARAAIDRLMAGGWIPHLWRPDRFVDADFDAWHGAAFHRKGHELDLHWRALRDGATTAGNDAFWARAVPARIGTTETRVLAAEDHVFHACVHGASWAANGRIDWVADAMMILRAAGPGFDWARVAALARTQRLAAPLEALIATLHEALGVAIPAPHGELPRSSAVERIEFGLRRRPPHRLGRAATALLALQDFRRREGRWLERPMPAALPAFGQDRWQLDRRRRVPGFAAFVALGRPPALRKLLAGDIRPQLLARRALPELTETRIELGDDTTASGALVLGWSIAEAGGRWTEGSEAVIALRAAAAMPELPVAFRLRPFAHRRHPPLSVEVWANDERATTWRFARSDGSTQTRGLVIDGALLARRPVLSLGLRIRHPGSPAAFGVSDDARRLGLFVEELRLGAAALPGALARPLEMRAGSPDVAVLWDGWSTSEPEGCWTSGPQASIRLRLPEPLPRMLAVELDAAAYLPAGRPNRAVTAMVGGMPVAHRIYGVDDWEDPLRFTLPASALVRGELAIRILIDNPLSPADTGASADARMLGLLLRRLTLIPL